MAVNAVVSHTNPWPCASQGSQWRPGARPQRCLPGRCMRFSNGPESRTPASEGPCWQSGFQGCRAPEPAHSPSFDGRSPCSICASRR